jgi:hypothetical protein
MPFCGKPCRCEIPTREHVIGCIRRIAKDSAPGLYLCRSASGSTGTWVNGSRTTTIGANSYAYLHKMVKTGRAESVGEAVDKGVEMARRLDNRATLERQTAAYFKGLTSKAAAEETDLEDALSAVSQEMDFDQP